ncbi:GNAT family N-acetyltransferase [Oceanicaulis sp. MMSF_3324]|uniref:GNAT family N-acetyltransferase n=1 Tax=Oceanicaulis sp. MMSF_3324 TaxID=3046702 RepID=UPI00273D0866|nr:GNAT family N-acetyltransferase [Oceanicaulis sp. MMSF_3324]
MRDMQSEPEDTPEFEAGAAMKPAVFAEIRTPRLVLRPLEIDDAAWIGPESARPEICRMTSRVPAQNPPLFAEAFILIMRAREQIRGDVVRAICEAETGSTVGVIGLHPHDEGWELGYWVTPAVWGQGYATEAAQGLCEWARAHAMTPFTASHFEDNPASGRVLEKSGFGYTGETGNAFSFGRMGSAPIRQMAMAG